MTERSINISDLKIWMKHPDRILGEKEREYFDLLLYELYQKYKEIDGLEKKIKEWESHKKECLHLNPEKIIESLVEENKRLANDNLDYQKNFSLRGYGIGE